VLVAGAIASHARHALRMALEAPLFTGCAVLIL